MSNSSASINGKGTPNERPSSGSETETNKKISRNRKNINESRDEKYNTDDTDEDNEEDYDIYSDLDESELLNKNPGNNLKGRKHARSLRLFRGKESSTHHSHTLDPSKSCTLKEYNSASTDINEELSSTIHQFINHNNDRDNDKNSSNNSSKNQYKNNISIDFNPSYRDIVSNTGANEQHTEEHDFNAFNEPNNKSTTISNSNKRGSSKDTNADKYDRLDEELQIKDKKEKEEHKKIISITSAEFIKIRQPGGEQHKRSSRDSNDVQIYTENNSKDKEKQSNMTADNNSKDFNNVSLPRSDQLPPHTTTTPLSQLTEMSVLKPVSSATYFPHTPYDSSTQLLPEHLTAAAEYDHTTEEDETEILSEIDEIGDAIAMESEKQRNKSTHSNNGHPNSNNSEFDQIPLPLEHSISNISVKSTPDTINNDSKYDESGIIVAATTPTLLSQETSNKYVQAVDNNNKDHLYGTLSNAESELKKINKLTNFANSNNSATINEDKKEQDTHTIGETKVNETHIYKDEIEEIKYPLAVELQPFKNKVGGHTAIFKFSHRAVCKALVNRENKWYETIELKHPELLKFMPRYIGVLNVRYSSLIDEADEAFNDLASTTGIKSDSPRFLLHQNMNSNSNDNLKKVSSLQQLDSVLTSNSAVSPSSNPQFSNPPGVNTPISEVTNIHERRTPASGFDQYSLAPNAPLKRSGNSNVNLHRITSLEELPPQVTLEDNRHILPESLWPHYSSSSAPSVESYMRAIHSNDNLANINTANTSNIHENSSSGSASHTTNNTPRLQADGANMTTSPTLFNLNSRSTSRLSKSANNTPGNTSLLENIDNLNLNDSQSNNTDSNLGLTTVNKKLQELVLTEVFAPIKEYARKVKHKSSLPNSNDDYNYSRNHRYSTNSNSSMSRDQFRKNSMLSNNEIIRYRHSLTTADIDRSSITQTLDISDKRTSNTQRSRDNSLIELSRFPSCQSADNLYPSRDGYNSRSATTRSLPHSNPNSNRSTPLHSSTMVPEQLTPLLLTSSPELNRVDSDAIFLMDDSEIPDKKLDNGFIPTLHKPRDVSDSIDIIPEDIKEEDENAILEDDEVDNMNEIQQPRDNKSADNETKSAETKNNHVMGSGNHADIKTTRDSPLLSSPSGPQAQSLDLSSHPSDENVLAHKQLVTTFERFILLEDLTSGMEKACVLDLKMGTRQYGVEAIKTKKYSQRKKCAKTTSRQLGVRLCGMQCYDFRSKKFINRDKYFGRKLHAGVDFVKSLARFLYDGITIFSIIRKLPSLIESVVELYTDFVKLYDYRLYGSSLLLMYDAGDMPVIEISRKEAEDSNDTLISNVNNEQLNDRPIVRMIDFAQCIIGGEPLTSSTTFPPVHRGEPDHGYLRGLKSLEFYFQLMFKEFSGGYDYPDRKEDLHKILKEIKKKTSINCEWLDNFDDEEKFEKDDGNSTTEKTGKTECPYNFEVVPPISDDDNVSE
ncbi:kinase activity protein [[Candida] boidinii]|nr:kinase activity protein [[Candida] boidinii]